MFSTQQTNGNDNEKEFKSTLLHLSKQDRTPHLPLWALIFTLCRLEYQKWAKLPFTYMRSSKIYLSNTTAMTVCATPSQECKVSQMKALQPGVSKKPYVRRSFSTQRDWIDIRQFQRYFLVIDSFIIVCSQFWNTLIVSFGTGFFS